MTRLSCGLIPVLCSLASAFVLRVPSLLPPSRLSAHHRITSLSREQPALHTSLFQAVSDGSEETETAITQTEGEGVSAVETLDAIPEDISLEDLKGPEEDVNACLRLALRQSPLASNVYTIELTRETGISWSSDFQFIFARVGELSGDGAAALSGQVREGDWLLAIDGTSVVEEDFDMEKVMDQFIYTPNTQTTLFLTFFRGTKEELCEFLGEEPPAEFVTVRVKDPESQEVLKVISDVPSGTNLRNVLVDNKQEVYQSYTKFTNCSGKSLCGTCVVRVKEGMGNCSIQEIDEKNTLRENPDDYRLSCATWLYGDVDVELQPSVPRGQFVRGSSRPRGKM